MCITFNDYKNFGYSIIPEEEFSRYSDMAEKTVRRYIKNFDGISNITDDKRRGICEIADILYQDQNQLNRPIASFGNENYREHYFEGSDSGAINQVWEKLRLYFTHEELYRGVQKLC